MSKRGLGRQDKVYVTCAEKMVRKQRANCVGTSVRRANNAINGTGRPPVLKSMSSSTMWNSQNLYWPVGTEGIKP
ncbi:uncharacterized protein N7503_011897 [Penicillium pulvis]|uniref:uncharacterized protein n=1 Tax=Penicillium pulvis TaxID=1562058 RepID=UPI002548B40C|nr:uncharacterized protein N7503_011897 [Penicillium pulvis]KAJ5786685.1 hypothetical protein N7503_011897 [Penicillium pulvis]